MQAESSKGIPRIVIADTNPQMCLVMRKALAERGVTQVLMCSATDAFAKILNGAFLDLIICDFQMLPPDVAPIVRKLRHGQIGKNPFATVIATVTDPDIGILKQIMNAGVDKIVRKPVTSALLFGAIDLLTEARQPFVIAPDYIGPTRRAGAREKGTPPTLIDAPNSFKKRFIERADQPEIEQLVANTVSGLSDMQLHVTVAEIVRLVARIAESYDGSGSEDDWRGDINRLVVLSEMLRGTNSGTGSQILGNLANVQTTLTKRVLASAWPQRVRELDLLIHLTHAVKAATASDQSTEATLEQIAQTLAQFA